MRMITGLLLAAALAAAPLFAQASDSANFGQRLITVGDSVARVYQVAGQPDRVVQLENRFGAGAGERLEYFVGEKVVQITINGSRVVRIQDVY